MTTRFALACRLLLQQRNLTIPSSASAFFHTCTTRSWRIATRSTHLTWTPWLDFEESVIRYRVQGTMFSEREGLIPGLLTLRPLAGHGVANGLRISGFYNAGWYAANRPRRLGIVMGSFEHTNVIATLQYLKATENPNAAARAQESRLLVQTHIEF